MRAKLLALVIGLAVLVGSAAVYAVHHGAPARGASPFDGLRVAATVGDAEASRRLTTLLLDEYRETGRTEALMEAMQWLDRDWDTPEFLASRLTNRVVQAHCTHPVVRWHWICNEGE